MTGAAPVRVCAVVPVFDHVATVADVVVGAAHHVGTVVVVDDGSRDGSGDAARRAAAAAPDGRTIDVLSFAVNRGKGAALLAGLRRAADLGFTHAVTIDADGQHRPRDIPQFLRAIEEFPDAIVVGSRDLGAAQVPTGSRVGRWVSNFWVLRTTGFDLSDTQSGFRSYPVAAVLALPLRCRRYDLEVEVLVRGAWAGCPLREVPIDVHYPERSERISHFRAFRDNVRISWTYTRLAARRLVPSRAARAATRAVGRPKTRLRGSFRALRELGRQGTRPAELSLAVATGVFIGATPLWGLHAVLAVYVCARWHLNAVAAFVGTNVSLPFVAPYLVFASIQCGHRMLTGAYADVDPRTLAAGAVPGFVADYIVGSLPVAAALSVVAGLVTFGTATLARRVRS